RRILGLALLTNHNGNQTHLGCIVSNSSKVAYRCTGGSRQTGVRSFLRLASLPLGDPGFQNPRETSCMSLSTYMERVLFYLELWLVDLNSSQPAIREILRFGGWQFAKPCQSILGPLWIRLLPKDSYWIEKGARP